MRASRLEEAETTIQEGIQRLPHDPFVLWQWGRVATKRHDWAEAERRWQVGQARHPKFDQFKEGIAEMQLARQLLELQEADAPAVATGGAEMGKLLARFESLGDNCEFGIVQRLAGIEPLGLLRWSNIQPAKLAQILNNGFEGVGDPANTELSVTVTGDYHLFDRRYFGMHTFINSGHASAEDLLPKMCRRLRFLKDKMIEDLTDGEKIFVHKATHESLSLDAMRAIKTAMQRYGNGVLLCVQRPPVPDLDKSVEVVEDGLAGRLSVAADPRSPGGASLRGRLVRAVPEGGAAHCGVRAAGNGCVISAAELANRSFRMLREDGTVAALSLLFLPDGRLFGSRA